MRRLLEVSTHPFCVPFGKEDFYQQAITSASLQLPKTRLTLQEAWAVPRSARRAKLEQWRIEAAQSTSLAEKKAAGSQACGTHPPVVLVDDIIFVRYPRKLDTVDLIEVFSGHFKIAPSARPSWPMRSRFPFSETVRDESRVIVIVIVLAHSLPSEL